MAFGMSSGSSAQTKPHTPTLGWTIGAIVVAFLLYHFLIAKK